MYTDDLKAHQKDALEFNKNADKEKPLLMTGQGFICFKPYLAEKRPAMQGVGDGAYELAIAVPADCPVLKQIKDIVKTMAKEKFEGQRKIKIPFKDGNDYLDSILEDATKEEVIEINERYGKMKDHVFFNAKTKYPLNEEGRDPQLIDHNLAELDPEKVFGGAIVRIQIAPYTFVRPGNKGVALGLRAVQVLKKSDWSGSTGGNAASNFGSAESQDDTESAADAFSSKKSKKDVEEPEEEVSGEDLSDDAMFEE